MLRFSVYRERKLKASGAGTFVSWTSRFSTAASRLQGTGSLRQLKKLSRKVPLTTPEEFKSAVCAAKEGFPSGRNTPITTRQRIMSKLQELIRRDIVDCLDHGLG